MKNFLSQNWFKSVIALSVIIISASTFYYFVILSHQKEARIQEQARNDLIAKNIKEMQNQEQAQIDLIEKNKLDTQKADWDSFVNKCITDAYTELKTLQSNFDVNTNMFCSKSIQACSIWREGNDKDKADAFTTYREEWVPQCKLGKRVFIHYEPMTNN